MAKRKSKKKDAAEIAAEMMEVNSITTSNVDVDENKTIGEIAEENIAEEKIEQQHKEAIEDSRSVGIEPIIELTPKEAEKNAENDFAELQEKYLEALKERDQYKEEITRKDMVISEFTQKLKEQTDLIDNYDFNESNYCLEITKLKSEIGQLENQIQIFQNEKDALSKSLNVLSEKLAVLLERRGVDPLQPQRRPSAAPNNGYQSWN